MPIATTFKPKVDTKPELLREEVLPAPKPVAVDSKYESRRNLLQYVSGAKWIVNYYKQIKTSEEASEAFNINRPMPYQQYKKIENFEIRVNTPLQTSPNNELATMLTTGSGYIYPSIVPDHGDTFIADVGDGRQGLFNIDNVTQKSYLRDTVYEVEYTLVNWLNHEDLAELDKKVVVEAHYERSYSDYGANPILDSKQHGLFKKISLWQQRIVRHYFNMFYNTEYDTFIVPMQGKVIYDPFLVEFIQILWTTDDHPDLIRLRSYNRDNVENRHIKTIWDVLKHNDPYLLPTVRKNFGVIPKRAFKTGISSLMGITYSRMDYIYHPIELIDTVNGVYEIVNEGRLNFKEIFRDGVVDKDFNIKITKLPGLGFVHSELQQHVPIPDANKFGTFDTYVLSPAFYSNDKKNMSKIERMFSDTLNCKPIDGNELYPILEDVINWGDIEQFYYIPLLVALSRIALGDLSQ